jgi:hypothetical protein
MTGVLAISDQEHRLLDALAQLRARGFQQFEVFTPLPAGQLFDSCNPADGESESKVRWYTLTGAVAGLLAALALTYGSSLAWPIITGGKPVTAFTGFSVIIFETTILFAGLFTVAGFFIHGGLFGGAVPGVISLARYSERFSVDTYGLFVPCDRAQTDEVVRAMRYCGLMEISIEAA